MKSSRRSYQSMRVLVVRFCLCACWMLLKCTCVKVVSFLVCIVDLVCSLLMQFVLMHICLCVLCISARVHVSKSLQSLCVLLRSLCADDCQTSCECLSNKCLCVFACVCVLVCLCGLPHICLSHCISPSSKGMSSVSPSLPICLP